MLFFFFLLQKYAFIPKRPIHRLIYCKKIPNYGDGSRAADTLRKGFLMSCLEKCRDYCARKK